MAVVFTGVDVFAVVTAVNIELFNIIFNKINQPIINISDREAKRSYDKNQRN